MPDSLLTMIRAVAVLNGLHAIDHVLRGDFHWPLDSQSVGFVVVIGTIYTVIGVGLTLSRRGVVGPRSWVTIGTGGLVLGWLSHFSPFTDQPASAIFHAYHSRTAGILAVSCLAFLMAAVLAATLQALALWSRQATNSSTSFFHKLPLIDLAKNGHYVLQKHLLNIRRLKFA
jgi:hypothetical protein